MAEPDDDEPKLCAECIGAAEFKQWIEDNGSKGACGFNKTHGKLYPVVAVEAFAEEVDRYFRETYQRGEEYMYATEHSDSPSYDTYGEPYKDILANDLGCDDERLVNAIAERLPDVDWHDVSQGAEAFYDETANYESIAEADSRLRADEEEYWYSRRFSLQWEQFCNSVQFERRFFKTKEALDSLFGRPEEYQEGSVRPLYELDAGAELFRARILDDEFNYDRLKKAPASELSAPPKERATAGRMNVEYIPAFYGAFSEATAIAEVRPSIGDRVAIGKFALQKRIRVFDFTVFSKTTDEKWKEVVAHTRYDFITQMEDEISKPILPYQKQREYIATQIVAEYLREYFGCDAVIYRSSMHKDGSCDNRNIVLFYKGQEFVGDGGVCKSVSHHLVDIQNIQYTTSSALEFLL